MQFDPDGFMRYYAKTLDVLTPGQQTFVESVIAVCARRCSTRCESIDDISKVRDYPLRVNDRTIATAINKSKTYVGQTLRAIGRRIREHNCNRKTDNKLAHMWDRPRRTTYIIPRWPEVVEHRRAEHRATKNFNEWAESFHKRSLGNVQLSVERNYLNNALRMTVSVLVPAELGNSIAEDPKQLVEVFGDVALQSFALANVKFKKED